jgi:hypothetical protein
LSRPVFVLCCGRLDPICCSRRTEHADGLVSHTRRVHGMRAFEPILRWSLNL